MISEASQVKLREIRESNVWCCIKIVSDYSYAWDISLTKSPPRGDDAHNPTVFSGTYEDLNDAINSLYLKHIEYIKNKS